MSELSSRDGLLTTINDMRSELDQAISAVDPAAAVEPETFGAWSFKDLIAHLTAWWDVTPIRHEATKANT